MFTLPMITSLAYFSVFLVYLLLGIIVFSLNRKETPNRIFSLTCLSLCLWSFSFAMQNFAKNPAEALFWGKIASFGWSFFYAFILHFALIITQKQRVFRHPLAYAALYLLPLINQYFFFFSPKASGRYEYLYAPFGWTDIYSRSHLVPDSALIYFSLYFSLSALSGMALLIHFIFTTEDSRKKKQVTLINTAFLILSVVSLLSDRILFFFFHILLPQSSVIFMIIPITTIFYAVKKYGLLQTDDNDTFVMGEILSFSGKKKVYSYLICFFLFYGLIFFASFVFVRRYDLLPALQISLPFFVTALAIGLLTLLPIRELLKDILITAAMSISVFFVIIRFSASAAVTVWAFPTTLLFLSIIINLRFMIIAISLTAIAAQIPSFFRSPYLVVHVDGANYILRIALSALSLWLAIVINRIYIDKLRENNIRLLFQKTILDIYTSFISINQINFSAKTDELLGYTLSFTGLDRAYFFSVLQQESCFYLRNEYCKQNIEPIQNYRRKFLSSDMPGLYEEITAGNIVHIPSLPSFPPSMDFLKARMTGSGMRSLLLMPVKNKTGVIGCIGLESSEAQDLQEKYGELLIILAGILSDAIGKMEAADSINFMAYYDSLTELPNRRLFKKQLDKYIQLAAQNRSILAIISMDIDNFQYVNDTIGHNGGDEILISLVKQISEITFGKALLSRFGGDEFTLMLYNVSDVGEIREICEKIMGIFHRPILHSEGEFFITASLGISVYPADGEDSETLIKNSDLAMYESKTSGKNQYHFCSDSMKESISQKMMLTSFLHEALEKRELFLAYQPQFSASDGRITGIEALLRWNQAELGLISPNVFIPLAEQTGLIRPVGIRVIDEACRQMKQWREEFGIRFPLAVNISLHQLKDKQFLLQLEKSLQKSELPADCLEIEIVESSSLEEDKEIPAILGEICRLGISISIDDFGTRYSSLSYLKQLPLHRLKIDMQFVHGITKDAKDRGITKSIIDLSKNLGLTVIAEGVETREQFDFLKDYGCDEVQGYYFSPPICADEISRLLREEGQFLCQTAAE